MPSGSGGGDRSISNFVVAIPNTKLRIGAEGGLARPIGLPATCQLQSMAKPLSVDANAVP
jgi:hypothetical protein